MQISDLLQLQAAAVKAGQGSQTSAAEPGRVPAAAAASAAAAAGEAFGQQLRRAIQRQASAAAADALPARRPEPAVGPEELEGLESLEASTAEAGAQDAGLQAPVSLPVSTLPPDAMRPGAVSDVDAGPIAGVDGAHGREGRESPAGPEATALGDLQAQRGVGDVGAAIQPGRADLQGVDPRQVARAVAGAMPATTDVLRAAAVGSEPRDVFRTSGASERSTLPPAAPVAQADARPQVSEASEPSTGGAAWARARAVDTPARQTPAQQMRHAPGMDGLALAPRAEPVPTAAGLPGSPAVALSDAGDPHVRPDTPVPVERGRSAEGATGTRARADTPAATPDVSARGAGRPIPAQGPIQLTRQSPALVPDVAARSAPIVTGPLPVDVVEAAHEVGTASLGAAPRQGPVPALVRGSTPLRASALGPGMDLVVGEEPDPGIDAVLSYARDSGLSAEALKKLFGTEATARASALPAATPATPAASAASAASAPPQPDTPLAAAAAQAQRTAEPAVLSMAAWIGGRAGASAAGPRSPSVPVSALRAAGVVSDRVDVAGASVTRPAGFDAPSPAGVPPTASSASSGAVAPPVGAAPASVIVSPGATPPSHAALAHRMAEATATRMVAELRQGNGRLRLQIEPASLGKVDIDMTMRQGALEATIVAHQAATRELLTDGLPRLRDTLAQLGMNVAGLDIRNGLGGQSDGKPTNHQTKDFWYSARRAAAGVSTSPVDGGDQRRSSRLDLWA